MRCWKKLLSLRFYEAASNGINPESLQRADDDDSGRWDPITYEKFKLFFRGESFGFR